jgi:hypothetical protein
MKKKYLRNFALLLLPFAFMVVVNELVRPAIKDKPYSMSGITAINSIEKDPHKCTWICPNNTAYCKAHHVKFEQLSGITDPYYFGTINLLRATGNYGAANIVLYVLFLPLFIWFFFIKILAIRNEINNIKKEKI